MVCSRQYIYVIETTFLYGEMCNTIELKKASGDDGLPEKVILSNNIVHVYTHIYITIWKYICMYMYIRVYTGSKNSRDFSIPRKYTSSDSLRSGRS